MNHKINTAICRLLVLLTISTILLLTAGCARQQPAILFEDPETRETIKRIALHHNVDFWHRCSSTAYERRNIKASDNLSADQLAVFDIYGQPDYVRVPFTSQFREETHEWLYLEQNHIFQFVGGILVHNQDATDLERTLVYRGYPRYYIQAREELSALRQTLIYRNWQGTRLDLLSFADGQLVMRTE
ncbi:MAG: hypothetical protein ACLFUS_00650 [Candidatus Sumerlaeia bacterium]